MPRPPGFIAQAILPLSILFALSACAANFGSSDADGGGSFDAADDDGPVPEFPLDGPILLTTEAMLGDAREAIHEGVPLAIRAFQAVQSRADTALANDYTPYLGEVYLEFYRTGKAQGIALRHLALAHHFTGRAEYLEKARGLLLAWADAGAIHTEPASEFPHAAGLVIGRVAVIFSDAFALLHHALTPDERTRVRQWLRSLIPNIENSRNIWVGGTVGSHEPPYLGEQYFNNHLGAQTMGLLAIAYATGDQELVARELRGANNPRDFETMFEGALLRPNDQLYRGDPTVTSGAPAVAAGEIYDRYRTVTDDGLHYASMHLRLLTLMSLMAVNNGDKNYFEYEAPGGETLLSAYQFYSAFVIEGRSDAATGYYAGDDLEFDLIGTLDIARRFYPNNASILDALEHRERVRHDGETFGETAALIFGPRGVTDRRGRWEFDTEGRQEGFRADNSVSLSSVNGVLRVALTGGGDPRFLAPGALDLAASRYTKMHIRLANHAQAGSLQVFFAAKGSAFSAERVASVPLPAVGPGMNTITVDLGANTKWAGVIDRLRIDPIESGAGHLNIDSIRLE